MVLRFAVCAELLWGTDESFYELVEKIAALGRASELEQKIGTKLGIELAPFKNNRPLYLIEPGERNQRRDFLKKLEVPVTSTHWNLADPEELYFTGDWAVEGGPHICCPDYPRRMKTAEITIGIFEYVTHLSNGNRVTSVWGSPQQRDLVEGVDHTSALDYAAEFFETVLKSDRHNVTIGFERLSTNETNFCTTMKQVNDLVALVRARLPADRRDNFYGMMDTKAAKHSGDDPVEVLDDPSIGKFVHIHAQDPCMGPPGSSPDGRFLVGDYYHFDGVIEKAVYFSDVEGRDVVIGVEPFPPFFDAHLSINIYDRIQKGVNYLRDLVVAARAA